MNALGQESPSNWLGVMSAVTPIPEVTIREFASQKGAWANIPPKRNRKEPICFSPYLYRARNLGRELTNSK
jgi:hypothetical protein